jgi:FkbM family methyltransferase
VSAHWAKSDATVYAFEPNPHAFKALEGRLASRPNAHCFQQAVLDRNDRVKLYFHAGSNEDELRWSSGSSLLDFKGNVLEYKFAEVEAIDLAEFIRALDTDIKILKLDVEGVEHAILRKIIERGLHKRIEHIFVETHEQQVPELQVDTDELRALIKSMNITNINLDW